MSTRVELTLTGLILVEIHRPGLTNPEVERPTIPTRVTAHFVDTRSDTLSDACHDMPPHIPYLSFRARDYLDGDLGDMPIHVGPDSHEVVMVGLHDHDLVIESTGAATRPPQFSAPWVDQVDGQVRAAPDHALDWLPAFSQFIPQGHLRLDTGVTATANLPPSFLKSADLAIHNITRLPVLVDFSPFEGDHGEAGCGHGPSDEASGSAESVVTPRPQAIANRLVSEFSVPIGDDLKLTIVSKDDPTDRRSVELRPHSDSRGHLRVGLTNLPASINLAEEPQEDAQICHLLWLAAMTDDPSYWVQPGRMNLPTRPANFLTKGGDICPTSIVVTT